MRALSHECGNYLSTVQMSLLNILTQILGQAYRKINHFRTFQSLLYPDAIGRCHLPPTFIFRPSGRNEAQQKSTVVVMAVICAASLMPFREVGDDHYTRPWMNRCHGGRAVARIEQRGPTNDEQKLAGLKTTTQLGALVTSLARQLRSRHDVFSATVSNFYVSRCPGL